MRQTDPKRPPQQVDPGGDRQNRGLYHSNKSFSPFVGVQIESLFNELLVAIQHEPNVKAFYNRLITRGKKPMQAVVAVMRKLLHAIWGMLKHDQDFDGEKFFKIAKENT